MLIREILLKSTRLQRGATLFVLVLACCLAISATYELIEWLAAVLFGSSSVDFIGTQGDEWDTQWDMFLATAGAIIAQLCLARLQERQLSSKGYSI
jgi:putative membrane protein